MDLFNQFDISDTFKKVSKTQPKFIIEEKKSASEIVRNLKHGDRFIGLTRGQFSLIDLIYSILIKNNLQDSIKHEKHLSYWRCRIHRS